MTRRVLSARELNRALLARQLLLQRSSLPLTRALERVAGLQTQYAPAGYISLWSRLRDFDRAALTRALEQRRAVQATLMRVTIHTVSAGDFWPFCEAIKRGRREWWLRVAGRDIGSETMERVAGFLRERLRDGPLKQRELAALVEEAGWPRAAWSGAGLWVDLVRVPPSGTWERRRADLYGLAETWVEPAEATEDQALEHLTRRYLRAFGPASLKDLATWAGLRPAALRPVVERLDLRLFSDESGTELLDLPRAPLPDPETPAPVRFLPTWDATLLVHARRTQILPETYRPRVFDTKTPHSVPTVLVDGAVAGTWRFEDGRVQVQSFERLPRSVMREVDDEADRLAAFHTES